MFELFFWHILRHTQISMNHRSLVQHIVFEPGNATGSVQQLGEPWSHQRTSGVALPQHLQQGRAKRGCGSGAWKLEGCSRDEKPWIPLLGVIHSCEVVRVTVKPSNQS